MQRIISGYHRNTACNHRATPDGDLTGVLLGALSARNIALPDWLVNGRRAGTWLRLKIGLILRHIGILRGTAIPCRASSDYRDTHPFESRYELDEQTIRVIEALRASWCDPACSRITKALTLSS